MDLLELNKKLQYEIVHTSYTFNVRQCCRICQLLPPNPVSPSSMVLEL